MKQLCSLAIGVTIGLLGLPVAAWGQSITAAEDGTGTVVDVSGSQYDISGGTQADANLFHSFEQLGLSEGEIANFLAGSDVENILGRVTGGDASFIDGLLQVSGSNANLFLMNPAGMIFGENARLNVPADFSATTANAIRIDEDWFRAIGTNDYGALTGIPERFAFATEAPGAIINDGDLSVGAGQRVQLVGGLVVNTGTISTPGGEITVEAVPGEGVVTVTQEGNLLSLGLPVETEAAIGGSQDFVSPQTVPQLLSNAAANVNGIVTEGDVVRLTQVDRVIPTDVGTAIASGTLDVSSDDAVGGRVDVLGEKVALVGAQVQASGAEGGGSVRVGGEYRGEGSLPNADQVYVDSGSSILANAVDVGEGGRIILWSDEATQFYGDIEATGGAQAGDGGFVEISSQDNLVFVGDANVEALNGEGGTLLLDPRTIRIIDSADGSGDLDNELTDDNEILTGLPNQEETTLSVSRLESFSGSSLLIEADDGITVGPISDNQLNLSIGTVIFRANGNDDAIGDFVVEVGSNNQRASIVTDDGDISISGVNVITGDIKTSIASDVDSRNLDMPVGDINIISSGNLQTNNLLSRRTVSLEASDNITVETISVANGGFTVPSPTVFIDAGGTFRATGAFLFFRNIINDDNEITDGYLDVVSIFVEDTDTVNITHGAERLFIGPNYRTEAEELTYIVAPLGADSRVDAASIRFEGEEVFLVDDIFVDTDGNRVSDAGTVLVNASLFDGSATNDSFIAGAIALRNGNGQLGTSESDDIIDYDEETFNEEIKIISRFEPGDSQEEPEEPRQTDNRDEFVEDKLEKPLCNGEEGQEYTSSTVASTNRNRGRQICLANSLDDRILEISEEITDQR